MRHPDTVSAARRTWTQRASRFARLCTARAMLCPSLIEGDTMVDASDEDMTKPVTRGELKQELAALETRMDAKLDAKLELLLGAIMARVDQQLTTRFIEFRVEVDRDFARHTSAMIESFRPQVAAVDDK
jgi:hypothetical protein